MALPVTKIQHSKRSDLPANETELGFGRYFTDHMVLCEFDDGQGWHDARIVPYAPLLLDPSAVVLHYAQQIFEGLKAYRGVDGGIRLFRQRKNLERMQRSARRMCMPEIDVDDVAAWIKQLVLLERDFIPHSEGCSLYVRPNLIATDCYLGVRPSKRYLFYIIACPVGPYYAQGFNPVNILVETQYTRAAQGGVGEAKTGGNYASSLRSQVEAQMKGFTQVLWLDGRDRRYVEEVGTMNIFFRINDEIITSPLGGTILPGITRDTVIHLLRQWGHRISERPLAIEEVVKSAKRGTLKEMFGSGTATVISPVGQFQYRGADYTVGNGKTGPMAQKLFDYIFALQYGREPDPFGWTERIDA